MRSKASPALAAVAVLSLLAPTACSEDDNVEFGANGDGLYIVRATTMPEHQVHETDVGDDVGYTYIRVRGDDVDVLERSYGLSPWDPARQLAADIRPPELTSSKCVHGDDAEEC